MTGSHEHLSACHLNVPQVSRWLATLLESTISDEDYLLFISCIDEHHRARGLGDECVWGDPRADPCFASTRFYAAEVTRCLRSFVAREDARDGGVLRLY